MARARIFVLILLSLLLLTGCWDRLEVEERVPVLSIGIDMAEDGELIISIAVPDVLGLAGGPQAAPEKKQPIVIAAKAKNLTTAFEQLHSMLAREVFLGYVRVLVISEEVAFKRDINEVLDGFRRSAQFRPLAYMIITPDKPEDIIAVAPAEATLPITYLYRMIDNEIRKQWLLDTYMHNFTIPYRNQGIEPVLVSIKYLEDRLSIAGLSAFKRDRLAGSLNNEELSDFLRIKGLLGKSIESPCNLHPDEILVVSPIQIKTKTRVETNHAGRITAKINIKLTVEIIEKNPDRAHLGKEHVFEEYLAKVFENRTNNLIKKIQHDFQSDIIGIGLYVRAYYPDYWKQINWDEYFPYIPIEVSFDVTLSNERLLIDLE
ncbi:Ger(x)C family spore germination protein [Desulfitibacter alkalitolerans]|uniref:Ger(x)C family spore germination protein n=1 Tax=Desulfitibacter alkalitolerans TaxID=264641 RepID=UPI0004899821|nr:Ger(x)C family spore germination protein [Desulfitibacter alkalitolerans]